ncbi:MAG: hypothetical protein R8M45_04295 [Ghiorsea sp.]
MDFNLMNHLRTDSNAPYHAALGAFVTAIGFLAIELTRSSGIFSNLPDVFFYTLAVLTFTGIAIIAQTKTIKPYFSKFPHFPHFPHMHLKTVLIEGTVSLTFAAIGIVSTLFLSLPLLQEYAVMFFVAPFSMGVGIELGQRASRYKLGAAGNNTVNESILDTFGTTFWYLNFIKKEST